ncbi:MAG: hypothetical protein Ct9H300mP12_06700 [Acidimicrobiales bacterium]|nr:MAG: hypothetical protein Ct9H300mP12_06700 [Acidimicrobiales bacterium]
MSEIWTTRRIELVGRIAEMGPTFAARADVSIATQAFPVRTMRTFVTLASWAYVFLRSRWARWRLRD